MDILAFAFLGFASILLGAFALEKRLPARLKNYSWLVTISLYGILLYQATFFSAFFLCQKIIHLGALIILIQDLIQSRGRNLLAFLKSNRMPIVLALGWFALTSQAQLAEWDEFSWGSFVKHLNHFGRYWDANSAILGQGLRYFPGISLWESFFLAQDHFGEGPLFFSVGMIFIAGFFALLSAVAPTTGWKKKLLAAVLFAAVVGWFSTGLQTVYVDATMGLLIGAILLAIHDAKKPQEFGVALIILLFFSVTKETALMFSLVCLFCIGLKILRDKSINKKWLGLVVGGVALMILDYVLWRRYLQFEAKVASMDTGMLGVGLSADLQQISDRTRQTLQNTVTAFWARPFPRLLFSSDHPSTLNSFFGSYFFWSLLFTAFFLNIRKKYEYAASFLLGLFGYTLFLLVAYLYFFGSDEGPVLASFERLIGVYFLGFAILAVRLILEDELKGKKILLGILVLPLLAYRPTPSNFIPSSIRRPQLKAARTELAPLREKIVNATPVDSRVWFIWQNSTGFEAMIMRFEIAPRHMNASDFTIGEPYYPGDVWTQNFSDEVMLERAQRYDYVALGKIDDKFMQRYGHFFQPMARQGLIYRVAIDGGKLAFVEMP